MLKESIYHLLFIILLAFTSCSKKENYVSPVAEIDLEELTISTSMKGWELYSWPNGNDWNYSILIGTNRLKSFEEVTTGGIIVTGKDSLKLLLDKFPEGEFISWMGEKWLEQCWGENYYGNLSLPDPFTIIDVVNFCNKKCLQIHLS